MKSGDYLQLLHCQAHRDSIKLGDLYGRHRPRTQHAVKNPLGCAVVAMAEALNDKEATIESPEAQGEAELFKK